MLSIRNHQKGIALLETLLVLAIASTVLYLGIVFYNEYSLQLKQQQLAQNVDKLFVAMKNYYKINCRQQLNSSGQVATPGSGKLDPLVASTNTVTLNIATDLVANGFLPAWYPDNPLVDNTPTDKGYFVQFNRIVPDAQMNVIACAGPGLVGPSSNMYTPSCVPGTPATNMNPTQLVSGGGSQVANSNVVIWTMQVAVKLASTSPQIWSMYQNQLNAECISKQPTAPNGPVSTCESSPTASGFLVWERAGTYVSENSSDLWVSEPLIKQFNMQYTNDSMQLLNGGVQTWSSGGASPTTTGTTQNYLCGE